MPFFQAKITRVKFTLSPFSAEDMMAIAQKTLNHVVERIKSVHDIQDGIARPLSDKYAVEKRQGRYVALGGLRKYSGAPYRDWTLRGRTLQALKVKTVSEDMATVGPVSMEALRIIQIRNKWDHMWGMSPSDNEALVTAVRGVLERRPVIQTQTSESQVA